ncbi:response regulator [Paenibacillus piri]|nr:response regulator [Paenibacillus piri]
MKQVIVVDDNELSVEGICKNIDWSRFGAKVCATCTNANDVLDVIGAVEADLIISDICMPQMSGLEMARVILKNKPHMKIIFISAYDDFKYAKEAIRLGICDYVEKPVDYAYLSEVIDKVLQQSQEEKRLLEQLQQSRPALLQKCFNDLINSSPDYAEFQLVDQAKYVDLDLSAEEYLCAVIRIDNSIEIKSTFGIERYHVLMMSLMNDLDHTLSRDHICYCSNQGSHIIVILGNRQQQLHYIRMIYEQLSRFNKKHETSPLSMTIGIGDIVSSIWSISVSYQQAKHALEYKFIFGEGHIFSIRDIKSNHPSPIFFTDGSEEALVRLISQKDIAGMKQFTDDLAVQWAQHYYDKNGIAAYIYSLLARLTRYLYDTGIDHLQIRNMITDIFADFDQFQTSEQICSRLYDIFVESCQILQQSVETHHHQIAERVIHYIEHHYMNIDLSLNDISSSVNVSPSYLGAVFKKAKGQNISDLITTVRINKAQELLSHTNLKMMEISEKIGYSNQYYFSACFKKKMGVTPTEYRLNVMNTKL